jgi:hypothetical protein
MTTFRDLILNEGKTKASTRLDALLSMLKPYPTNYKVYGNEVRFGFFNILVNKDGYILTKNGEVVDTFQKLGPIEKIIEDNKMAWYQDSENEWEADPYLFNELGLEDINGINETLSTIQKEQLKALFVKSIEKFDESLSIMDFAKVVGEVFNEQYGKHNLTAFEYNFKQTVNKGD